MGSWSVYCGISNISITAGQKCVLLPLKKNNSHRVYIPYLPATLPIFGNYDDYGCLEDIEENENTKFIEQYFNCSIHDFCYYFTRGCISIEDVSKDLRENKEIKDWTFMFIDRKVYDFLSNFKGGEGNNNFDLGNAEFLKYLGAEFIGKCDDKRYDKLWNLNGSQFKSDGTWLHTINNNQLVYSFNPTELLNLISEDKKDIFNKPCSKLWSIYDTEYQAKNFWWIIGVDGQNYSMNSYLNVLKETYKNTNPEKYKEICDLNPDIKDIANLYCNNFNKFGDYFSDLVTIKHNISNFSGYFAPYILYLTPQCGENSEHQKILEKFAEINKSYIEEIEEC